MAWFRRKKEGIRTKTEDKKEIPDGLWNHCKRCKNSVTSKEHKANKYVCLSCDYHDRISAQQYFEILYDNEQYEELFADLAPVDVLNFSDKRPYKKRLELAQDKTKKKDALQVGFGKMNGIPLVTAAMDFKFIGGSMGAVVGQKIALAIDHAIAQKAPFLIISKSGGARMMESAFSLMQMAKTAAKLTQLSEAKLPFISLLTDPTTGGVSASFAMLGDMNIAEPNALIGFAGPRVIRETIKRDLPEGFQTSEFLLEHGFLDLIVERENLKEKLTELYSHMI